MISKGSTVSWRNLRFCGLLVIFSTLAAQAKKPHIMSLTPPTPEQAALIDRASAQEKRMAGELRKRIPMVQTYIQNLKPDGELGTVPVSDQYILSRVDFDKSFQADGYREKSRKGLSKDHKRAQRAHQSFRVDSRICAYRVYGHDVHRLTDFDRQHTMTSGSLACNHFWVLFIPRSLMFSLKKKTLHRTLQRAHLDLRSGWCRRSSQRHLYR